MDNFIVWLKFDQKCINLYRIEFVTLENWIIVQHNHILRSDIILILDLQFRTFLLEIKCTCNKMYQSHWIFIFRHTIDDYFRFYFTKYWYWKFNDDVDLGDHVELCRVGFHNFTCYNDETYLRSTVYELADETSSILICDSYCDKVDTSLRFEFLGGKCRILQGLQF